MIPSCTNGLKALHRLAQLARSSLYTQSLDREFQVIDWQLQAEVYNNPLGDVSIKVITPKNTPTDSTQENNNRPMFLSDLIYELLSPRTGFIHSSSLFTALCPIVPLPNSANPSLGIFSNPPGMSLVGFGESGDIERYL
jgi:hypothetical protein